MCAAAAYIGSVSSVGVGSVSSVGAGVGSVGTLHGVCRLQWERRLIGAVIMVRVGHRLGSEMFAMGVG